MIVSDYNLHNKRFDLELSPLHACKCRTQVNVMNIIVDNNINDDLNACNRTNESFNYPNLITYLIRFNSV